MSIATVIPITAALISLYVWVSTRPIARLAKWKNERWFGMVALTAGAYIVLDLPSTMPGFSGREMAWIDRPQMVVAAAHIWLWVIYSRGRLGRAAGWPERLYMIAVGALAVLCMATPLVFREVLAPPFLVPWLGATYAFPEAGPLAGPLFLVFGIGLVIAMVHVARALRGGDREAPAILIGLVVLFGCAISDSLSSAGVYDAPLLLDVGFMVPVAVHAVGLSSKLLQTATDLDAQAKLLQREVQLGSEALAQTRSSLDRSERLAAIGQLAAGVAHEVNNPAAALHANLGYLREELGRGVLPDDAVPCLEESLEEVERIARIVRQLRDSARAAAAPVVCEPVDVAEAVSAARGAARAALTSAEVHVSVPEGLTISGQELYLVQVLTNLIVNAAQAVESGQHAQIQVRAEAQGERVSLEVADRGTGMSPEVLAHLFEPFFTTKAVGKGTGLGLAVSRGLVHAMGGELSASSEPGRGTRMRLDLRRVERAVEVPTPTAKPAPPRRRAVLIDDDPDVRSALGRSLRPHYDLVLATGVDDGLARIAEGPAPELVLCDLAMADGGGERLYVTLRERSPRLAQRLIFITGGATTEGARRFIASQPQPVLHKPFDVGALVEAAEGLIRVAEA